MDVEIHMNKCDDGSLQFVITCKNPQVLDFDSEDLEMLIRIDEFINGINTSNKINMDIKSSVHGLKDRYFNNLNADMKRDIQDKIHHQLQKICTETYNWIYDHQTGALKQFMQEFNPERVCYFFNR